MDLGVVVGLTPAEAWPLEGELADREVVLSALSEGVLLFDAGGRLEYANPAAEAALKGRAESLLELSPEAIAAAAGELRQGREREGADRLVRTLQLGAKELEATYLAARDGARVVVILRDATPAGAVERLRRDFVANASHELKTPVASILALSGTLRDAVALDPGAADRFLVRLEQEAQRLAALVTDLLDLSRLEAAEPIREEVRLDRLLDAAADRIRTRAEAAGLRLLVVSVGPVATVGSPGDLSLLFENLLDNAVRYTPEGGEIEVWVRSVEVDTAGFGSQRMAEVSVTDTGLGIPVRDLDRVFERFYRVDEGRSRDTGGTGLGLAIVRHVAEAHGGTVEVRSVLGSGSRFTVRLPYLPA